MQSGSRSPGINPDESRGTRGLRTPALRGRADRDGRVVAQIAHRLKRASSRALHLALPETQGLVWQVGYWAESVTPVALEPLVA
jgi:hypothetical protein